MPRVGSRSTYGFAKPDGLGTQAKGRKSEPPTLPRRGDTLDHNSNGAMDQSSAAGPALSVRERMANLSMASQRQISSPSNPAILPQSAPLPPRLGTKEQGKEQTPSTVHSPLSSAARPALPPRTLSPSPMQSPSLSSSAATTAKHVYQVQDAAVPVPKLTTFARPRSARTGRNSGLSEQKQTPSSSPASNNSENPSTPPKLPNRTPSIAVANTPNSNASSVSTLADKPSGSGPVRFSPSVVRQTSSEINALPAISRNTLPLPLPSRNNLNTSPLSTPAGNITQGLPRSATTGGFKNVGSLEANGIVDTTKDSSSTAGSPFGVRLNSVGSRTPKEIRTLSTVSVPAVTPEPTNNMAPPLPARSTTISSTPLIQPIALTTPSMKLQREVPTRPFSSFTPNGSQVKQDNTPVRSTRVGDIVGRSWGALSSPSKAALGSGVTMPSPRLPESSAPETVGIKWDARKRYEALFNSTTSGDYIEGAKVHAIYVRSRLDSKTLAQIW
ncbi:hypothetical protein BC939DRAFT_309266 [Gamsiella multidivaricata]|uniref:uncharacterized protein n=1 Tax=Gamsiella multidivaricata TaxID=101098 RepID=UPI002220B332|nr:uncharacterized protein BC939DRAFT_309266 [Gamsiella multidivaricata]KAI7818054.1 hypothetical protein BC939DRAFT_309266 [Gamsiella multidivaricata]